MSIDQVRWSGSSFWDITGQERWRARTLTFNVWESQSGTGSVDWRKQIRLIRTGPSNRLIVYPYPASSTSTTGTTTSVRTCTVVVPVLYMSGYGLMR